MVILSTSKYTMQTRTPILNAKLGKHYARLMHLSLIWLSPLIFVRKMILKVIETSGSMCRRLQFYHYVSFSTIFMSWILFIQKQLTTNLYCQLISVQANMSSAWQTGPYTVLGLNSTARSSIIMFHGLRILILSRQFFFLNLEMLVLKTCDQW